MNNFYQHSLNVAKKKYYKFKRRLEKKISSGQFDSLSRRKKNTLISRVEKYRSRLDQLGFSVKGAAVAGSVAAMAVPAAVSAQTPYFKRGDQLPVSSTQSHVAVANIDDDSDMEILFSTTGGGRIMDRNDQGDFEYDQPISLSEMTREFLVGDIDGDNEDDIVFVEEYSAADYLVTAINQGDGTFSSSSIGDITNIQDVELVDFDSDGDLDVVVSNQSYYLYYFQNDGSGSFAGGSLNASFPYDPVSSFAFDDVDDDGDMDLIRNGRFQFVLGPGSYSYRDRLVVQENTAGPNAIPNFGGEGSSIYTIEAGGESDIDDITLFDQDGDGDLDIAFRYRDNSSVNYIQTVTNLYDVSGYFAFSANGGEYLGNGSYGSIAVFDFDNDGDDDLLVDNYGSGTSLLRNDTNGSTFTRYNLSSGSYGSQFSQNSFNFAFGDFNNDSVDDVIATSSNTPAYIFENASEFDDLSLPVDEFSERTSKAGDKVGDFTARDPQTGSAFTPTVSIGGPDAGSFTVAGGEINVGSTDLDFETQSEFNITAQSTLNGVTKVVPITLRLEDSPEEGYGTFEKLTGGQTDYRMGEAQMADIDGDGNDDLIFLDEGNLYIMDVANSERPESIAEADAFQVVDLDGDGDIDIAVGNGGYIYQRFNDGIGDFSDGESFYAIGYSITDIEVVDLDNDGDMDFVIGTESGYGAVIKNFGSYFSYFNSFGSNGVASVALGDIDDDGFIDIVHTDFYGDYINVIRNNEGYGLNNWLSYSLVNNIERVEAIDLDNDGDVDILASGDRYVHIFDQTTPGASAPFTPITYAIDSYSINESTIALGDFDGDEDIDIVLRQYNNDLGGESAVVYLNDGNNGFNGGQQINFDQRTYLYGLAVGDIDGDDDLDVVGGYYSDFSREYIIKVLENKNVAPYITGFSGSVIIDENTPAQTVIGSLDTYDPNGDDISISLQGDDAALFSISAEGEVRTEGDLDWESIGSNLDVSIVLSDGNSERIEEAPLKINNLTEGGSGTFSDDGLPLFGVQEARFFEPGDYDLDGDQDLFKSSFTNFGGEGGPRSQALDSFYPNSLFIQTDGNFGEDPIESGSPFAYVRNMVFNDVDNDGDLDFVANVYNNLLVFNNDEGEFSYTSDEEELIEFNLVNRATDIDEANAMQFGDVDGDGIDELIILERNDAIVTLDNDDLDGEFEVGGEINVYNGSAPLLAAEPNDMAIADFDGDGIADAFIATEEGDDYIFFGGESGFSTSVSTVAISHDDNGLNEITVADLDADGDEDIAILRRTSDNIDNLRIDVHLNDGSGTFTLAETLTQGGEDFGNIQSGDIDGDGSIDLISTGIRYVEGDRYYDLTIFANDGDGSFTSIQTIQEVGGESFKLMDVDGDDDLDIVTSDRYGDDQYLRVFKNVNVAPTGISLSNTTIDEALPLGSAIATVSVEDPNPSDTHVTFIASGDGSNDADNANFVIDGDQLLVIRNIEFNDGSSLNINIRAIDQEGESVTQSFTLSVNEVLGLDDENSNFILYPNPGNEQIAISIDHDAQGSLELQVRDISGKLIHRLSGEKNAERWTGEISMLNQEPGIYVVEIDINGEKFSQRWIKK